MQIVVSEGEEVFFDTADHLMMLSEEEDKGDFDYGVWLKEPQSVKHRRDRFLSTMGFVEDDVVETEVLGLEAISESITADDDELLSERRGSNSEARCSGDYSDQDWLNSISDDGERGVEESVVTGRKCEGDGTSSVEKKEKKVLRWWKSFTWSMKRNQHSKVCKESKMAVIKAAQNRKRYTECTGVYPGQEIRAHNGLIWTMKFSPDGQYLASGGEDGMVCVWRVRLVDASCEAEKCSFSSQDGEGNSSPQKKNPVSIVIPEKIFRIEEEPMQKLKGHTGDVLDLAWSTSNHLLSSSTDKTVRMWQVGSDECLGVFRHSNYVTCVQFNPVDENRFISGSIDGKVRTWGVHTRRVEDWANVRDIVTAVCYQPNGKGFIVGSISGSCRFYELSGGELVLNAELNIQGKKKSHGNKITGIQFLNEDSQRVMITSEDSKIRILDGLQVVRKYKGLTKSGSQMSASLTSSGRHIISVGEEDSRIYLWNYENMPIHSPKQVKSVRSCEHFFSEGVSVALPWSHVTAQKSSSSSPTHDQQDALSSAWESDRFSLANWFSMEGSCRASVTWPEEKLPSFRLPSADLESTAWGLVFVTADCNGTIRTFHNYGLPARI